MKKLIVILTAILGFSFMALAAEDAAGNWKATIETPNGTLVFKQIAGAIARLLTDKKLAQRLTTNAATLVDTRYIPENYVRSLVEIYRKVIDARQQTR